MASTLSFRVEVAADQATQSLQVLSQAFNQAGITAKAALLKVGEGGKGAASASTALEQRVKSLKAEMASGDRTINFFANSLNAIVPEASAAGQSIRLLADGLIGGLGLGLAIQGVMAILQSFGQSLKEAEEAERQAAEASKQAAAERLKAYQDADRELRRLQFLGKGGTEAAFDAQEKNKGVTADVAQARKNLDQAQFALAALRGSATGRAANPVDMEKAVARVREAEAALKQVEATAARVVGAGALKMEDAAGKAAEALAKQGEAARKAGLDLRNLAEIQNSTVGFGAGTTRSYMPERTGMITAGQAGDQFLASFQKNFVSRAADEVAETEAAKKRTQELSAQIASTWGSALAQMAADTEMSARSLVRVFSQAMAQMISAVLPAQFGPFGALFGAFAGGFASRLPSAAGGWWEVPQTTLAMVHGGERIWPADKSRAVDRLLESGGAVGGGGITVNVGGALDGLSVERVLTRNDGALARVDRKRRRRMR